MKLFFIIFIIPICGILFFQCASQKKIEYNLPEPMSAENRAVYMDRLEKGKILYKLNCSSCHGIFTKGKDSVPNFTKDQINNYRSAVLMANDKKNHSAAAKMNPQQLDYIILFLSLRKHEE
jgi:cytochrome c553